MCGPDLGISGLQSHGLPTFHPHSFVFRCHLQSSAEAGQQQAQEEQGHAFLFFLLTFDRASEMATVGLLLQAAGVRSRILGRSFGITDRKSVV